MLPWSRVPIGWKQIIKHLESQVGTQPATLINPLGRVIPRLVDGHQFLHAMPLYECPGVLWAVCDDLVDGVQQRHHRVSLQVLGRVLLPVRQVPNKVPQRVAP